MTTDEPKRRRRWLGSTWSSAGPAVALVASVVALAFTLSPGLSPDPRAMLAATLKVQGVDLGTSHYSYLEQYYPGRLNGISADDKAALRLDKGSIVNLLVQIQGKKHGSVKLDYVAFDWNGRHLIEGQGTTPHDGFRADTPNDQWLAPIFVYDPVPPRGKAPKAFFLRFRLFDGDVLLALADTPRIPSGA